MKRIQIEIVVFRKINAHIEFLLLKRIKSKGGFWQPPCGGLEKCDKSVLEAAFRELEEEANIRKDDVIKVYKNVHQFIVDKHYLTGKPISPIFEFAFAIEVKDNAEITLQNNINIEHDEIRWVGIDEALKLLKWKENKDAFEKVNSMVTLERNHNNH